MMEETGRALLATMEELTKLQKQLLASQLELVDLARPILAGHWGNGAMALAAIGVAAAMVGVLAWFSVKPGDVGDVVVAVFHTIGRCPDRLVRSYAEKRRELTRRRAAAAADKQHQQQQQVAPAVPAVAPAVAVVAPAVAPVVAPDLERGDAVRGDGGSGGGAFRRRNQRSSEED
jgi:hypothetical protein